MINSGIISLKISKFYLILCIIFCIKYNSGGSGTVTAGLPQGETKGFYLNDILTEIISFESYTIDTVWIDR